MTEQTWMVGRVASYRQVRKSSKQAVHKVLHKIVSKLKIRRYVFAE